MCGDTVSLFSTRWCFSRDLWKDKYFAGISQNCIGEIYALQNSAALSSAVLPVWIHAESSLFPYLTRTVNASVYLTFQVSNLLCEKNKNSMASWLSKLCGKKEICLLPFGRAEGAGLGHEKEIGRM